MTKPTEYPCPPISQRHSQTAYEAGPLPLKVRALIAAIAMAPAVVFIAACIK